MKLNDIVEKSWDKVKRVAKPIGIAVGGTYLLFNAYACDLFNKEDPDPVEKVTITNEAPAQGSYTDKHKETHKNSVSTQTAN